MVESEEQRYLGSVLGVVFVVYTRTSSVILYLRGSVLCMAVNHETAVHSTCAIPQAGSFGYAGVLHPGTQATSAVFTSLVDSEKR